MASSAIPDPLSVPRLMAPVNEFLAPAIRQGLANPLPLTSGFVVLEVTGRRSGKTRSVPLLCIDYGPELVVSTVRADSQWVSNLAAEPNAFVWLRGRRHPVQARVFRGGRLVSPDIAAPSLLSAAARAFSMATGTSVAVLTLR